MGQLIFLQTRHKIAIIGLNELQKEYNYGKIMYYIGIGAVMAVWVCKISAGKEEIGLLVEAMKVRLKRLKADCRNSLVAIAVEMLNNIAEYAYCQKGDIVVEIRRAAGKITLVFKDWGIPFNPSSVESVDKDAQRGLGIIIAKNMADSYSYSYRDGMNISSFEKNI